MHHVNRVKGKCFTQKFLYINDADSETVIGHEIDPFKFYTELSVSRFKAWQKSGKALEQLCETSFKDDICEVLVYSSPLTKLDRNENLLYHAFAIFKTKNIEEEQTTWWSVEKNGEHIVLQRSMKQDQSCIRDYLYTKENSRECAFMSKRNTPVKLLAESSGRGTLFDFLRALSDRHDLNKRYHFIASNCQEFASFVFNTIIADRKKWNGTVDGALMKTLTRVKKYPSIFTDAIFGFSVDNKAIVEFHRDRWIAKLLRRRFIPLKIVRHRRRDNIVSVRVATIDGNGVNGAAEGRDYVAINQVIDFNVNEVEKQIIVEILCNDSNNRHAIYFGVKLYLNGTNAAEKHDVMIGYYSSQTVQVLLTDECNQRKFALALPLSKDPATTQNLYVSKRS